MGQSRDLLQVLDHNLRSRCAGFRADVATTAALRFTVYVAGRSNDTRELALCRPDSSRQYQRYSFGYLHLLGTASLRRFRRLAAGSRRRPLWGSAYPRKAPDDPLQLRNDGLLDIRYRGCIAPFLWTGQWLEISGMVSLHRRHSYHGAGAVFREQRHLRSRPGLQNRRIDLADLAKALSLDLFDFPGGGGRGSGGFELYRESRPDNSSRERAGNLHSLFHLPQVSGRD